MEIPVINFEPCINSLNNPSLISRLFSIFELGKLSHAHRLWKWGALFLAFLYAISSLVNKFKILIRYYHYKSKSLLSSSSSEPLLSHFSNDDFDDFDTDTDEDEDGDVVCSTSDSSSDEEEDESYVDTYKFDDDFTVKGCFRIFSEKSMCKDKFKLFRGRKSFVDNLSLSDLVNGNGVVKLWDGLGLGVVDVNDAFSFLDFDNYSDNGDHFAGFSAVSSSPAVFVSAASGGGKMGMDVWDLRTGGGSAAVHSEWRSDRRGEIVGVDSGRTGKVYIRDDVTKGLTVGDLRKVETPLTECEEEKWWDADGVSWKESRGTSSPSETH